MKHLLKAHGAHVVAFVALFTWSCQKPASQPEAASTQALLNELTEEEKAAGWELLFDGTTLTGWKRHNADTIGPLWIVQDGVIVCNGTGFGEGTAKIGGSLNTIRQFGNFELSIDWKISPGGNSGIIYHVVEDPKYKHSYETGPEYQVLDDAGWKDPSNENQKAASNYGMFAAPADKKLNPVGEWNNARILYNNGHVEHWLNGVKTVEFQEDSPEYIEAYKNSKWMEYPDWNKVKKGSISLQDHGSNVYFRNIKIRAL